MCLHFQETARALEHYNGELVQCHRYLSMFCDVITPPFPNSDARQKGKIRQTRRIPHCVAPNDQRHPTPSYNEFRVRLPSILVHDADVSLTCGEQPPPLRRTLEPHLEPMVWLTDAGFDPVAKCAHVRKIRPSTVPPPQEGRITPQAAT